MQGQPNPEKILQTGLAFWASKTLLSAIEMGVFTELARGPERFDALSGRLGLHSRSARDFLDALVHRSVDLLALGAPIRHPRSRRKECCGISLCRARSSEPKTHQGHEPDRHRLSSARPPDVPARPATNDGALRGEAVQPGRKTDSTPGIN